MQFGGVKRSSKRNYNSLVSSLYSLNYQGDLLQKFSFRQYLITILQLAYSSIRVHRNILSEVRGILNKSLVILAYVPALLIYMLRK